MSKITSTVDPTKAEASVAAVNGTSVEGVDAVIEALEPLGASLIAHMINSSTQLSCSTPSYYRYQPLLN